MRVRLEGALHIHVHHAEPGLGVADILEAVRQLRELFLSKLSDVVAELQADDTQLAAEVQALVAALAAIPDQVNKAVADALAAANVADDQAATTLQSVDDQVKASIAAAMAALGQTPPAPADTTGGGAGNDTLAGGQG